MIIGVLIRVDKSIILSLRQPYLADVKIFVVDAADQSGLQVSFFDTK